MSTNTRKNARNGHGLASDWLKIKHTFADTADDVRFKASSMVKDSMDSLKNKSHQAQDNITDYTARNPFKALGIALLTGAFIGIWLKKR